MAGKSGYSLNLGGEGTLDLQALAEAAAEGLPTWALPASGEGVSLKQRWQDLGFDDSTCLDPRGTIPDLESSSLLAADQLQHLPLVSAACSVGSEAQDARVNDA